KLRCTATPPASANAIASLISRRSKYFSRIGTDRSIGAQLARRLRVLGSEGEVACGDPARRVQYPPLDERVVGLDVELPPAAHVEQDQAHIASAGEQAAMGGQGIDPKLQRIGREELVIERGIGFEVDQRDPAFKLADPVDQAADPRPANVHVEACLHRERPYSGKRVM